MTFTCVTIAVRSSSWPWLLPPRSSSLDFQLDNMQLVTLANLPEGLSDVINSLQVVEGRVEGRKNWALERKAGSYDLFNLWSSGMLNNIEYVESIKEYTDLPKEDQVALFMANYPLYSWFPCIYKCYEMEAEAIPLGDGTYLPAEEEDYNHLRPAWEELYGTVGSRLMNEVVAKMKEIDLTKEEYLILRALALMTPGDYLSQESYKAVETMNSALQTAILEGRKRSTEDFQAGIEEILKTLMDIGSFETRELVHLAPPRQEELVLFLGVAGS